MTDILKNNIFIKNAFEEAFSEAFSKKALWGDFPALKALGVTRNNTDTKKPKNNVCGVQSCLGISLDLQSYEGFLPNEERAGEKKIEIDSLLSGAIGANLELINRHFFYSILSDQRIKKVQQEDLSNIIFTDSKKFVFTPGFPHKEYFYQACCLRDGQFLGINNQIACNNEIIVIEDQVEVSAAEILLDDISFVCSEKNEDENIYDLTFYFNINIIDPEKITILKKK